MKNILVGLAFCFVSVGAWAQATDANAPATREDIEHYLSVMHSHDMMQQSMAAMLNPLHKMVHEQFLKDKDKLPPDFEERTNKMMDDLLQNMPFDQMMQAVVPVYQKHFTKGDVEALLAFYSSPTGQKMIRELPSILSESMESMMPIMQNYMQTVGERVQQEFTAALKESEKKTN